MTKAKKRRPENRARNGRFKLGHSIGRATRFKPGTCPNPGGRPRTAELSKACREILAERCESDKKGRTWAERIAYELVKQAIKGSVSAAAELADRAEGRPRQAIELDRPDPILDLINEMRKASKRAGPPEPWTDDEAKPETLN